MHWDGKMLSDLTGRTKVDRIAVLNSYDGSTKFSGAPKIQSGSGKNIAEAVFNVLVEWNNVDKVVAANFDTTSSNTGLENGACAILNELLNRQRINLGCRHHIYEIIVKNVFEKKYGSTSAPETIIFNRFADEWDNIKENQFDPAFEENCSIENSRTRT